MKKMICDPHPEHGEMQYIGRGYSRDFGCYVDLWHCQECPFSKRVPVEGVKYTPLGVENVDIVLPSGSKIKEGDK